jgi:hypothetical protein
VLRDLERWGAERAWIGPDPYEGLNSPLGGITSSPRARQAVVQVYKRLPVQPPWPLRAAPRPNAKALALALSGYATRHGRRLAGADRFLSQLPAQLEGMSLGTNGQGAWGYPFDAQTRHLFYSRDTPNAIATCFVVNAFCDAAAATQEDRWLGTAMSARPYLVSLLDNAGHRPFFAYVASGSQLIHNANIMVCGTLARLHRLDPDEELRQVVCDAAETTISRQRPDGLWDYGEAGNLRWADNFHTAYILEGLSQLKEFFGIDPGGLHRGVRAWRERFFDAAGWARYAPDKRHPLEAHSCASAIDLLCRLAEKEPNGKEYLALADRVAATAVRELWLPPAGCFAFKRTALGLNRRRFIRWTNAPMFRALANLCSADHGPGG